MNRTETLKIMAVLKAAYPRYYSDSGGAEGAVSLWQLAFEGDKYDDVSRAVMGFIKSDIKGYPPHIGAIADMLLKLKRGPQITEQEAWHRVYRAVCKSAYGAKRAFDDLPAEVRQVVGSPKQLQDWSQMEEYVVNTVIASNFQRSYRGVLQSQGELAKAPELMKNVKTQIGDSENAVD